MLTMITAVNYIIPVIIAIAGFQSPILGSDIVKEEYDFIVVGAGSAGSVVAGRLTEDPNVKVLLLEAGGYPPFAAEIPLYAQSLFNTSIDWKYKTTPQTDSCLAYSNNECDYTRGKVLGGSSTINGMMYIRGNHRDYDYWASLGNRGWAWTDVLPYFLKYEGNTIPWIRNDTIYHNSNGSLTVSQASFKVPLQNSFLEAGQENGYPIRDVNGQYQSGVMPTAFTMRNGSRCSTYKAFLEPASFRSNLRIMTDSLVLKVLFDNETKAVGVLYSHKGEERIANCKKEVILSAGTINSPQILMLSGVGPADHLNQFNITIVADLPGVGKNVHDHVGNGALVWSVNASAVAGSDGIKSTRSLLQWLTSRTGPLTVSYGIEGVGFFKSSLVNKSIDWPDVEIVLSVPSANPALTMFPKMFPKHKDRSYFSMLPLILRPKSVGSIQLQSSDPFASPLIDPGYFKNSQDVTSMVDATKFCLQLANSSAFKDFDVQLVSYIVPGCENYTQFSGEYWACTARQLTIAGLHAVGSCKMGTAEDDMAVVNSQLEVCKTKALRVVDASIMPYIVSGNTNAPAIMIGEKGSDAIKKEWGLL